MRDLGEVRKYARDLAAGLVVARADGVTPDTAQRQR